MVESTGGRRKRKREVEGSEREDGASWEGVRRGGGGVGEDREEEVHYLLPLKARGKLVLQAPVPNPNGTHDVFTYRLCSVLSASGLTAPVEEEAVAEEEEEKDAADVEDEESTVSLHTTPKGRPRVYVSSRKSVPFVYSGEVEHCSPTGTEGSCSGAEEGSHC